MGLEALRAVDPAGARAAARKAAEPFTYAAQVDALVEIYRRLGLTRRSVGLETGIFIEHRPGHYTA